MKSAVEVAAAVKPMISAPAKVMEIRTLPSNEVSMNIGLAEPAALRALPGDRLHRDGGPGIPCRAARPAQRLPISARAEAGHARYALTICGRTQAAAEYR